jgi:hypothetical protein
MKVDETGGWFAAAGNGEVGEIIIYVKLLEMKRQMEYILYCEPFTSGYLCLPRY